MEDCVFAEGFFAVSVSSGSVTSIRNSSFEGMLVGVLAAGKGTRINVIENTFEKMGFVGAQAQAGAIGQFEDNTFNDCNTFGFGAFACIGYHAASGEAVGNTIDETLRGVRVIEGDVLIEDNEITQFDLVGIEIHNAVSATGFDNNIEDAAGGDTDYDAVLDFPDDPVAGTVQVIDNKIDGGAGVGLLVRAPQFSIEGSGCVGP